MMRKLFTVYVFAKINTSRYFRDVVAIFFTVAFPLILLFVFGGIFGKASDLSFKVALINQSNSQFAQSFVNDSKAQKVLKVNSDITSLDQAKEKMTRGELDAAIILPSDFGSIKNKSIPSGKALVYYTQNNEQAGQALVSVLQAQFKAINAQFVKVQEPFTVSAQQTNDKRLSTFDYTFSGLLGFSIMGLGIFGPVNVFPELKRQGILRRFNTTPIRVWQYFLSNVFTQAIVGLFTMAVLFAVAILVFHLNVVGNYFELALFLVLSIITILGIGLALGGWAKNQRQAAPLTNLVVFPMMFLSGTFFPRFLMPEWLQQASSLLPLTPMIDGIRLIITEGKHFVDLAPQLGLMGLWLIVIYFIAFKVFRWE
ncbi:MAG TPA: ABC transporter permease [Patescibacteria group bacterium]|jgi:ABC-2 type transport system permease protein|nr:ABC transporter permease [Patescibacteria group bacterium]